MLPVPLAVPDTAIGTPTGMEDAVQVNVPDAPMATEARVVGSGV
ncbi:hypothetical protein [Streptococcus pneumoniae]|nr:hypothetical protein [Streptococcus pneumoniae]